MLNTPKHNLLFSDQDQSYNTFHDFYSSLVFVQLNIQLKVLTYYIRIFETLLDLLYGDIYFSVF